jgi:hypothetical protein
MARCSSVWTTPTDYIFFVKPLYYPKNLPVVSKWLNYLALEWPIKNFTHNMTDSPDSPHLPIACNEDDGSEGSFACGQGEYSTGQCIQQLTFRVDRSKPSLEHGLYGIEVNVVRLRVCLLYWQDVSVTLCDVSELWRYAVIVDFLRMVFYWVIFLFCLHVRLRTG